MLVVETSEKDSVNLYASHYYKTSYEKLKESYLKILTDNNFRIVSIDDSYSEVFAEQPHMSIQAKIIEQNPKETSIDFYISSEFLFGNRKKVNAFLEMIYTNLEKEFELKGLGLHK